MRLVVEAYLSAGFIATQSALSLTQRAIYLELIQADISKTVYKVV